MGADAQIHFGMPTAENVLRMPHVADFVAKSGLDRERLAAAIAFGVDTLCPPLAFRLGEASIVHSGAPCPVGGLLYVAVDAHEKGEAAKCRYAGSLWKLPSLEYVAQESANLIAFACANAPADNDNDAQAWFLACLAVEIANPVQDQEALNFLSRASLYLAMQSILGESGEAGAAMHALISQGPAVPLLVTMISLERRLSVIVPGPPALPNELFDLPLPEPAPPSSTVH